MKDNFEHILQDKLRDFSVKAGPRDWTAIERSLGLDVKVRKRVPLYRYAAAAAAAVLLAVGGFYLWRVEPAASPDVPFRQETLIVPPAQREPVLSEMQETEALEGVRKLKEAIERANAQAVPVHTVALPETRFDDGGGQPQVADPQGQPAVNGGDRQRPDRNTGTDTFTRSAGSSTPTFVADNRTRRGSDSRRTPNNNWGLSLFANGIGGNRNDGPGTEKMLAVLNSETSMKSSEYDNFASDYLVEYDQSRSPGLLMAEVSQWDHSLPLSFGFMVRKNLTDRWGLEIGVTYSYLASKQETSSVLKKQQLHYLGVPVAVTYTPFRAGAFDFYGRAGGAADFNIAGRTSLQYGGSNPQITRFTKEGVQWSVSANLGVMYNISPVVGIYFEPGVSHRFEFSNQPESYWKEHPTSFNMQVGVRTNF